MINRWTRWLDEAMRERGLDGRSCYARAAYESPGGRRLVVECSDPGVLGAVASRADVDASRGRPVRVAFRALPDAAGDLPDRLMVASGVADIRSRPDHASERVSQVVSGEVLEPLKEEGEWFLARLEEGYIGWIRSWHVIGAQAERIEAWHRSSSHRVAAKAATLRIEPDRRARPAADLVIGTRLVVRPCGRRGWRRAEIACGVSGFIRAALVESLPRPRVSRRRLAATAMGFLGVPYAWGGTTPKGFDCSGLIQRIFRLNGIGLPRDADQQSAVGLPKPVGEPRVLAAGDLMFFGQSGGRITHVALVVSDEAFLHAYGEVRLNSWEPGDPRYAPDLISKWRATRDPLDAAFTSARAARPGFRKRRGL